MQTRDTVHVNYREFVQETNRLVVVETESIGIIPAR